MNELNLMKLNFIHIMHVLIDCNYNVKIIITFDARSTEIKNIEYISI